MTHVRLVAELATEGPTPYARLGDLAVGLALLTIGGAVVAAVVRTRVAWWGAEIPTGEGGPR